MKECDEKESSRKQKTKDSIKLEKRMKITPTHPSPVEGEGIFDGLRTPPA